MGCFSPEPKEDRARKHRDVTHPGLRKTEVVRYRGRRLGPTFLAAAQRQEHLPILEECVHVVSSSPERSWADAVHRPSSEEADGRVPKRWAGGTCGTAGRHGSQDRSEVPGAGEAPLGAR